MKTNTMDNKSTRLQLGPRQRIGSRGTEDMLSLRDILDTILDNWKWFVLSVVFALVLHDYIWQVNLMYTIVRL